MALRPAERRPPEGSFARDRPAHFLAFTLAVALLAGCGAGSGSLSPREALHSYASALREGPRDELAAEFADVLAWLVTIANVAEIDLQEAVLRKYGRGCPGCGQLVCVCDLSEKP